MFRYMLYDQENQHKIIEKGLKNNEKLLVPWPLGFRRSFPYLHPETPKIWNKNPRVFTPGPTKKSHSLPCSNPTYVFVSIKERKKKHHLETTASWGKGSNLRAVPKINILQPMAWNSMAASPTKETGPWINTMKGGGDIFLTNHHLLLWSSKYYPAQKS